MKKPSPEKTEAKEKLLKDGNHAFYVGKFIPQTTGRRIKEILSGNLEKRLYSKEFYLAMLEEAYENAEPDCPVAFFTIPQLSEFFNGKEDVQQALSIQHQKSFIIELAIDRFKKPIVALNSEDFPRHKALFQQLRESFDQDAGHVDVEKALGGNEDFTLSDDPDSLELARYLYAVSKEYPALLMDFRGATPDFFEKDMPEDAPQQYYALAEVAIRLADIRAGITVHGGAERQNVYDRIIRRIIRGKKGNYRKCEQLKPLFELMKGADFKTFYVDAQKNPYMDSKRMLIKGTRFAMAAMLGTAVMTGVYERGAAYEEGKRVERERALEAQVFEDLKRQTFYLDGPHIKLNDEMKVEAFNNLVEECLRDMRQRYKIGREHRDFLLPLLRDFLLKHPNLQNVRDNNFYRLDEVDEFVRTYKIALESLGIHIDRPYAELAAHKDDMLELIDSDEDVQIEVEPKEVPMGPHGPFPGSEEGLLPDLEELGSFVAGEAVDNVYSFYWHSNGGRKYLVARDTSKESFRDKKWTFSSERAREGARQFIYGMERYDGVQLGVEGDLVYDMEHWRKMEQKGDWKSPCNKPKTYQAYNWNTIKPYKDSISGRFDYEYVQKYEYDEASSLSYPCLFARVPGEDHFSYSRTIEMLEDYEEMRDKWYDFHRGHYYEAEMPLDTVALADEVREKMFEVMKWKELLGEQELPHYVQKDFGLFSDWNSDRLHELLGEYDGSYSATRDLVQSMDNLRVSHRTLEEYMQKFMRSFPSE